MVLPGAHRVVACQVADEAANGRQPAVARRPGIAPTRLQVVEERRHAVDVEIRQAELRHGALRGVGHEAKEERQSVAVGEAGVSARPSDAIEVVAEKGFDEPGERGVCSTAHGRGPAVRNRRANR